MTAREVVIVASGGANIASLQFALERLGAASAVSADAGRIRGASHVILPGVGAAADAMSRLRRDRLDEVLPELRQPVLGICLGMQLLFDASDEGNTACLGIIPGRAVRFTATPRHPVPHIGWNTVEVERESALLEGFGTPEGAPEGSANVSSVEGSAAGPAAGSAAGPVEGTPKRTPKEAREGTPTRTGDYAYFVHSYALPVSSATVASTRYEAPFSACVARDNFFGAQFHPERSAAVGARLLRNFLSL